MSLSTITTSRTRADAEPLLPHEIDQIRSALGGNCSRKALCSFGVNHATLIAALAAMPIAAGSRSLIRDALKERQPKEGERAA
jgi:hypothetical protein